MAFVFEVALEFGSRAPQSRTIPLLKTQRGIVSFLARGAGRSHALGPLKKQWPQCMCMRT